MFLFMQGTHSPGTDERMGHTVCVCRRRNNRINEFSRVTGSGNELSDERGKWGGGGGGTATVADHGTSDEG